MSNPKRQPDAAPAVDHGATGPAMLARKSRIGETPAAGVTVRICEDSHLIDRMHNRGQLIGRPHEAACRLLEMAFAAGLLLRGTARLGSLARASDISDATAEARAAFNRALRQVPGHRADLIMDLLHERHPGTRWLATLQAALDDLGKGWGMPV
jgi:hypothetical protein